MTAAPSQTTDRVDGADWTFAGEGGFRRVRVYLTYRTQTCRPLSRRERAAVGKKQTS